MTLRVLVPTGCVGYGFRDDSLAEGLARRPDFIGMDAGSSDPGPYYLGSGNPFLPEEAVRADLERVLPAAKRLGIPVLIGTAGGAGANAHLELTYKIVRRIAREKALNLKVALIRAELEKEYLKERLADGSIMSLGDGPELTVETIGRLHRVVGMMGLEPFQEALQQDVDVILGGRACDAAIFSSFAVDRGVPRSLALHAAKIIQCGNGAVVERVRPDGMFCEFEDDSFVLTPLLPGTRCTIQSVISLGLYENADPYRTKEPRGELDTSDAWYEEMDDGRSVRVGGSRFNAAPSYSIRLEGVERVGSRAIMIGGIRDTVLLQQITSFRARFEQSWRERVVEMMREEQLAAGYSIATRLYGLNGVMGEREIETKTGHEVGLVLEALAESQPVANSLISIGQAVLLHLPVDGWSGQVSNIALPYSPATIPLGETYRFTLNHAVVPSPGDALFPIEILKT